MKPTVPNELVQAIARGDGVAFVGSGPSMLAGFPSWPKLLELMLNWCATHGIAVDRSDIENLIDSKKFLVAAEALRANMGDRKYFEFLQEVFDKPNAPITDFHRLLFEIPFAAAATTNYETLVERAFRESKPKEPMQVFTQVDYRSLGTALNSKQFFVLKAHGTIERPETIVLTDKDYATLIHKSAGYRTFLKALFMDRTVLFLGFGLNDPELRLLLEELREIFEGHTPNHYALLDVTGTTATEQKNFESHFGIKIIPYTPSSSDHPEVTAFLRELTQLVRQQAVWIRLQEARKVADAEDPNYRAVFTTDNEFIIKEKYSGASIDHPLKFSFTLKFDTKTPEGRKAHEDFKRHLATGERITIEGAHIVDVQVPEIISRFLNVTEYLELTTGPSRSDKTLVVNVVIESDDGETARLDNIILKNIQSGQEQMILSNEDQGLPWTFRQVIRFDEKESMSTFLFHAIALPVKRALEVLRFCRMLARGGVLRTESVNTGSQLAHAIITPGSFAAPDPQLMQVLEALEGIQKATHVFFDVPEHISVDEARHILTVAEIVTTGKATMMPPEMNFTVKELQELIPKFKKGVTMAFQNYADGWVSIVLGKEVHLGPILISCDKLHITHEDGEQAMKHVEGRSLDEVISVRVTPVDDLKIEAKYIAWLPPAEADAVRNTPLVRTTSLNNLLTLLFDTTVDTVGAFDIDEFIKLLTEAKLESTDDGVALSPLLLATEDDYMRAFDLLLQKLETEKSRELKTKLVEKGWLRDDSATSSQTATAA